uniref:Uncharacterized protein n=1 Tax=Avena sativa TaxID=4498 RepID=A0ACD5T9A8_AVESA
MEKSSASGGAMARAGMDAGEDIESLLKRLNLKKGEKKGVKIGGERIANLKEEVKWLALGRVHTRKTFSAGSLFETMHHAWGLAKEIKPRILEENLFLFQAACLGDWKRIMEEGPWLFRDQGLVLGEYDGFSPVNSIPLNLLHVWIRIPKIPDLFKKEDVVRDLASKVGIVEKIELRPSIVENYVRARVKLNVDEPLMRFVTLELEDHRDLVFQVLYEKLPRFCGVCGLMGHVASECGDGVHPP